jgi:hypothetical protein
MTVGAMEDLVPVEKSLDKVFSGWDFGDAPPWIAKSPEVHNGLLAGFEGLDINPENELGPEPVGDLEPWLGRGVGGKKKEHPAVERRL